MAQPIAAKGKGFSGTDRYIATRDLEVAVNASVTLGRPLLVENVSSYLRFAEEEAV